MLINPMKNPMFSTAYRKLETDLLVTALGSCHYFLQEGEGVSATILPLAGGQKFECKEIEGGGKISVHRYLKGISEGGLFCNFQFSDLHRPSSRK